VSNVYPIKLSNSVECCRSFQSSYVKVVKKSDRSSEQKANPLQLVPLEEPVNPDRGKKFDRASAGKWPGVFGTN
jgi:hypothetical protein